MVSGGYKKSRSSPSESTITRMTLLSAVAITLACCLAFCSSDDLVKTRIVGGGQAPPGLFPYQAALQDLDDLDLDYHEPFCGGVIVHPHWILTAAHCLKKSDETIRPKNSFRVVVGATDLKYIVQGDAVDVDKIIVNPNFSDPWFNDIALIRTEDPMIPHETAGRTTTIPYVNPAVNLVGITATVSGWGATYFGGSSVRKLRATQFVVQPDSVCDHQYSGQFLPQTMVCTGDAQGLKDACVGDSGGPVTVADASGRPYLVALVAGSDGCADGVPSLNTKIAPFIGWITHTIQQNEP